jgi:uncharacterized protein
MTTRAYILGSAAVLLTFCVGTANAASFSCRQQLPEDMRMICRDPGLNRRDSQAASLYNQLSNRLGYSGRAALKEERIGFLRERGACGLDRDCMMHVYDDQISRLRSMFPPPSSAPLGSTQRY